MPNFFTLDEQDIDTICDLAIDPLGFEFAVRENLYMLTTPELRTALKADLKRKLSITLLGQAQMDVIAANKNDFIQRLAGKLVLQPGQNFNAANKAGIEMSGLVAAYYDALEFKSITNTIAFLGTNFNKGQRVSYTTDQYFYKPVKDKAISKMLYIAVAQYMSVAQLKDVFDDLKNFNDPRTHALSKERGLVTTYFREEGPTETWQKTVNEIVALAVQKHQNRLSDQPVDPLDQSRIAEMQKQAPGLANSLSRMWNSNVVNPVVSASSATSSVMKAAKSWIPSFGNGQNADN